MAIQVVHGGKFIKTEEKKEMHDVPEKLEMYFSRSKINFKVNLAPMSYIKKVKSPLTSQKAHQAGAYLRFL